VPSKPVRSPCTLAPAGGPPSALPWRCGLACSYEHLKSVPHEAQTVMRGACTPSVRRASACVCGRARRVVLCCAEPAAVHVFRQNAEQSVPDLKPLWAASPLTRVGPCARALPCARAPSARCLALRRPRLPRRRPAPSTMARGLSGRQQAELTWAPVPAWRRPSRRTRLQQARMPPPPVRPRQPGRLRRQRRMRLLQAARSGRQPHRCGRRWQAALPRVLPSRKP
jgi:hypothetical protein